MVVRSSSHCGLQTPALEDYSNSQSICATTAYCNSTSYSPRITYHHHHHHLPLRRILFLWPSIQAPGARLFTAFHPTNLPFALKHRHRHRPTRRSRRRVSRRTPRRCRPVGSWFLGTERRSEAARRSRRGAMGSIEKNAGARWDEERAEFGEKETGGRTRG